MTFNAAAWFRGFENRPLQELISFLSEHNGSYERSNRDQSAQKRQWDLITMSARAGKKNGKKRSGKQKNRGWKREMLGLLVSYMRWGKGTRSKSVGKSKGSNAWVSGALTAPADVVADWCDKASDAH